MGHKRRVKPMRMTAHSLAKLLLDREDLPVVVPCMDGGYEPPLTDPDATNLVRIRQEQMYPLKNGLGYSEHAGEHTEQERVTVICLWPDL